MASPKAPHPLDPKAHPPACGQVDILKREVGRLTHENNQLRQDLLREADARAGQEKGHYQAARQLEAQLAAAQFAGGQAEQRLTLVERENDGLKQKAASLLSIGQQCSLGKQAGCSRLEPPNYVECACKSSILEQVSEFGLAAVWGPFGTALILAMWLVL